ncbi:splicing regulator SDE2 [Sorex araneus]|uniref:splicing regulator SDE2 n=1 Tax=Sorex araneus TaxID=42254 RepID=UPI002433865B|nr:splicing regulator SDE2 [Sorex araneus]
MAESGALVWVRGPGLGYKAVPCAPSPCSVRDFVHQYCRDQDIPVECFFVKCNGALVSADAMVRHGALYSLEPRLLGGKGGFGSMLRALGAQIEKTTNREACRDLSGRRLRDVNHEKAMAEWVKQQAEREAEKEQKRLERLQRKLVEPRHCFTSPDYQQQCHEMAERLEDSVLKGMQAASSKMVSAELSEKRKRPYKSQTDRGTHAGKKKCFWSGLEGLEPATESSSESSDEDSETAASTSGMQFRPPPDGSGAAEPAAELPSAPHRVPALAWDSGSPETLRSPATASGNSLAEDPGAELRETSAEECVGSKKAGAAEPGSAEKEDASQAPMAEGTEAAPNPGKDAKEVTHGTGAARAAPGDDGKDGPAARLEESQSGSTGIGGETIDLLAFSSAAEMESLGLEKLKSALLARGLKCGGTLQERAVRLFSVRGLARDQIDPALFAKPVKGKKK